MSSVVIYLDESGDLGWKFDQPYRNGGSSRHLTIAALIVPSEKKHLPKRLIKDLYHKQKWNKSEEKKWASMNASDRECFASESSKLRGKHADIVYRCISVKKQNVQQHIRLDSNKLYNYMIKLLLLDEMAKHENVTLIPDPRSIKVESGNSLHDYLQTELWFSKNVSTVLKTTPVDSKLCLGLQFSDMLSGVAQTHFEDGNSAAWELLSGHFILSRLFF